MAKKQEDNSDKPGWEQYQADLKATRERVAQMSKEEQEEYKRQRRHLLNKWNKTAYY